MTPQAVIAKTPIHEVMDGIYLGTKNANAILTALAKQGYVLMRGPFYPMTIDADYKVHNDGDQVRMLQS